jgi:hypothetical protein
MSGMSIRQIKLVKINIFPVLMVLDINVMLHRMLSLSVLWLYGHLLDLCCFFQFIDLMYSPKDSLDGGSARRKAVTYTQDNTNTE